MELNNKIEQFEIKLVEMVLVEPQSDEGVEYKVKDVLNDEVKQEITDKLKQAIRPRKKHKISSTTLFEPDNWFTQTHKFIIGESPHTVTCRGMWMSLIWHSKLLSTTYENSRKEQESSKKTLDQFCLMQNYPINTDDKRTALQIVWSVMHQYLHCKKSVFKENLDSVNQVNDEQWLHYLQIIVHMKEMVDYFQFSRMGDTVWFNPLSFLINNAPKNLQSQTVNKSVQELEYMQQFLLRSVYDILDSDSSSSDSSSSGTNSKSSSSKSNGSILKSNLKRLVKILKNECSINGCTESIFVGSRDAPKYSGKNMCDFHFNGCEILNYVYFPVKQLLERLQKGTVVSKILYKVEQLSDANSDTNSKYRLAFAKITFDFTPDTVKNTILVSLASLTEKEAYLMQLKYTENVKSVSGYNFKIVSGYDVSGVIMAELALMIDKFRRSHPQINVIFP